MKPNGDIVVDEMLTADQVKELRDSYFFGRWVEPHYPVQAANWVFEWIDILRKQEKQSD